MGYDLDEELPDHSSLTRIRKRYGLAVFRRFFEAIVGQCREAGLVWGKELYFDATQVKADASLDSIAPRFAVEAHLGELFTDEAPDEAGPAEAESQPIELRVLITEVERNQLARANEERHDWLARDGAPDRTIVPRPASPKFEHFVARERIAPHSGRIGGRRNKALAGLGPPRG